jgi:hypothetical protein
MRRRTFAMVVGGAIVLVGVLASDGFADSSHDVRLRAELSGDAEVPPRDPDGDGRARVVLRVDQGVVCFRVKFDDIGTANRGHIHRGAAGVNGPIVVAFFDLHLIENDPDPRHETLERKSELEGCVENLDPVLLQEIANDPAGFYVNLHNARFPGGAVRGQLED